MIPSGVFKSIGLVNIGSNSSPKIIILCSSTVLKGIMTVTIVLDHINIDF